MGFLLRRLRAKDLTSDDLSFLTCKAGVIEIPALGLLAHKMADRILVRQAGQPMSTSVSYQKKPKLRIDNEPSAPIESHRTKMATLFFFLILLMAMLLRTCLFPQFPARTAGKYRLCCLWILCFLTQPTEHPQPDKQSHWFSGRSCSTSGHLNGVRLGR